MLEAREISTLVPVMRPECADVGVFEPDAMSMDVAALHEGYLRGFRALGGVVTTDAEVLELSAETRRMADRHTRRPLSCRNHD